MIPLTHEAPVETLVGIAYLIFFIGISIALVGVWWHTTVRLYQWIDDRQADRRGPKWRLVPPLTVIGLTTTSLVLLAIEVALLAGIVHILT